MKTLKRDFTRKEKILILVLTIIILGLLYYLVVDRTVRTGIAQANEEAAVLEDEANAINAQVQRLSEMQDEIMAESGDASYMPSYNASKQELEILNDVLGDADSYTINFSDLLRDGDQIKREFTLSFTANSYGSAVSILDNLENSNIRCLLGDFQVSASGEGDSSVTGGSVSVNCTATFYETMYGGIEDSDLPQIETAPEVEEEPVE